MAILAAAFGLLGTVLDLVKQAENASQEKHDAILAALQAATASLQAARDAAHASIDADNADMAEALKTGTPPAPPVKP